MSPSRTRLFQSTRWLALAAATALVACACSDEHGSQADPISNDPVVFEGDANDAQYDTFQQKEPRDWAWAGGRFDAPDDDETLAAATPSTFAWHADPADFAQGGAAGDVVMTHRLLFSAPSQARLLEVFSTLSDYTPDAISWQKLVEAREAINVSLTTGTFVGDDLPDDGGPFIGQTLTFTIE